MENRDKEGSVSGRIITNSFPIVPLSKYTQEPKERDAPKQATSQKSRLSNIEIQSSNSILWIKVVVVLFFALIVGNYLVSWKLYSSFSQREKNTSQEVHSIQNKLEDLLLDWDPSTSLLKIKYQKQESRH